MTPAQVFYVSGAVQRERSQRRAGSNALGAVHGIPDAVPGTVDDLRALASLPLGR